MDDEHDIAGGYGFAALCLQMALLNTLAEKGVLPADAVTGVIARAREAAGDAAQGEAGSGMSRAARAILQHNLESWKQRPKRH